MELEETSPSQQQKPAISATRVTASTLGAIVGLAGMEHGFFELLQGNATTSGLVIDAIGPAHKLWSGATEPALTLIPNFLVSGILAMTVGFLVTIWAVAFVHKKGGAIVLLLLSIVLFLVGGGSPPIFLGVVASAVATRINKPLKWWPLQNLLDILIALYNLRLQNKINVNRATMVKIGSHQKVRR